MGDYWLHHLQPDYMEEFAKEFDKGMLRLFKTYTGTNMSSWLDLAH